MDIRKLVKYLIVKNPLYEIGLNDIILLKISQEKTENLYLTKFSKYKDHLIILDNAGSHNNELIKNAIIKSGNHYLFAVPYTPKTDAIEQYFNQVKTYLKKDRNVANFQELEKNVEKAINKVKPENYKNYFDYAYNLKEGYELKRKSSTRRRKIKIYKV